MSASSLLLKNRTVLFLWLGQIFSQVGTRIYQIAISWWLVDSLQVTKVLSSGVSLSILFSLSAIPGILFQKQIGRYIDEGLGPKVVFFSELLAGSFCLYLFLFIYSFNINSGSNLVVLLSLIFTGSFVLTLFQNATDSSMLAIISKLVKKDEIETVTALFTTTSSISSFAGAFMGAVVIGTLGLSGSVFVNFLSYIISFFFLLFIYRSLAKTILNSNKGNESQIADQSTQDEKSVPIPMKFALRILYFFAIVNFFLTPTLLIVPLAVKNLFQGTSTLLSISEAILAMGLIIGSFSVKILIRFSNQLLTSGMLVLGMGLAIIFPALNSGVPLFLLALFSVGALLGLLNVKIISYFHEIIPEEKKGFFFAKLNGIVTSILPISFLIFGQLSSHLEIAVVFSIQAVGLIIAGLLFLFENFKNERGSLMNLQFKRAEPSDIWDIMKVYQKLGSTFTNDPLFTDFEKMQTAISTDTSYWVISKCEGEIATVLSFVLDQEQGLSKISRIVVNPEVEFIEDALSATIRHSIVEINLLFPEIDVIYCTTLTIPIQFQETTLKQGFQVLGIFPNAQGIDSSRINGITAIYLNNTLSAKRSHVFKLHPEISSFYNIIKNRLNLSTVASDLRPNVDSYLELRTPDLEIIEAPNFVEQKFNNLKSKRKQMTGFYPFHYPNVLITDPKEEIQIFLKVFPETGFAAIIAEDILSPTNPITMYQMIFSLLRKKNITYFEVINDATDSIGIELVLRSGFVPCGYIPAFKRQNEQRRDFVVFCKSFEYMCFPDTSKKQSIFGEFYNEYIKRFLNFSS